MDNKKIRIILQYLVNIRHEIFEEALNYSMNNELKEFNDKCDAGDEFEFNLAHLDNSNDANLQLLVDLIKKTEQTCNSLANLNKIDLDELNT